MGKPRHSKEEVERALAEIGRVIADSIIAGWRDYEEQYTPHARLRHRKVTRAAIVFDHAREHLAANLADEPRVQLTNQRGLLLVILDGEFAIKVPKRLSSRRLSRTFPTQQTLAFLNQDNQGRFDFLNERTSLVIGYELDKLELGIKQIHVTCPDGPKRNHFAFALAGSESETKVAPLPVPGLPESPIREAAQRKPARQKKSGETK